MTTIVLLDTDTEALETLAPALSALRPEWIVHPLSVGQQALELVMNDTVDVVVTEISLPDVDGTELLDELRSINANVIRFTLTSEMEAEVVMENTRVHHRFLAKPVEPQQLVDTIDGSIQLRLMMSNELLHRRIKRIKTLPSLPVIYEAMTKELAAKNSSLVKVGEIIETDIGLSATILKIVNSSFYGLNRRVESVAQAVTFLGVHLIKNITLTAKVFAKSEGSAVSHEKLWELNQQALRTGALSNQFARYAKLPKTTIDHCQISGMMANVGELIDVGDGGADDVDRQISTCLLGAYLLRSWMMPDPVVEAIALQHEKPLVQHTQITPHAVLHSVCYLQQHCKTGATVEQRESCLDYLSSLVTRPIAELWLDAHQAQAELTADSTEQAA